MTGTFTALILALERRDHISEEEKRLLEQLPFRIRMFAAGEELVSEGSRPTESCLVLNGFAARQQYVSHGKRQLTAIHIAGDFVDLHSMLLKVMDHSIVSLGGCLAAFVPHTGLQAIIAASPHLGRLLWLSTVIDGAIERNWVTCLGRRPSNTHLAHLICELYARLETVGLVRGQSFQLPVTQSDIADIVGLSVVHVNRMIQELRASGLIIWDRKTVTVLDIDRLRELADFDPTYLNLMREPR